MQICPALTSSIGSLANIPLLGQSKAISLRRTTDLMLLYPAVS